MVAGLPTGRGSPGPIGEWVEARLPLYVRKPSQFGLQVAIVQTGDMTIRLRRDHPNLRPPPSPGLASKAVGVRGGGGIPHIPPPPHRRVRPLRPVPARPVQHLPGPRDAHAPLRPRLQQLSPKHPGQGPVPLITVSPNATTDGKVHHPSHQQLTHTAFARPAASQHGSTPHGRDPRTTRTSFPRWISRTPPWALPRKEGHRDGPRGARQRHQLLSAYLSRPPIGLPEDAAQVVFQAGGERFHVGEARVHLRRVIDAVDGLGQCPRPGCRRGGGGGWLCIGYV